MIEPPPPPPPPENEVVMPAADERFAMLLVLGLAGWLLVAVAFVLWRLVP